MKPLSSAEKARAWELAASVLEAHPVHRGLHGAEWAHILTVIVPSLRRRAEIVRRNKPRRAVSRQEK